VDPERSIPPMEEETPCPECGRAGAACTCCEGCGHDCLLDHGEPWCPVCLPEGGQRKPETGN